MPRPAAARTPTRPGRPRRPRRSTDWPAPHRSAGPPWPWRRPRAAPPPPACRSPLPEHDAGPTVGVGPGDRALLVAHLIAGAAFEALLVVEQDAALGGGHEQVRRARIHAGPRRARAAHVGVHG